MGFPEEIKQRAIELYQGRSAAQALKALEKEFPQQDMPTDRTIRRWHNKKLLEGHFKNMVDIAVLLISGFGEVYQKQKRGNQFDTLEYSFWTDGYGYGVTREWLGSKLGAHIEIVMEQYPHIDWKSFLAHIVEEFPDIKRIGLVLFANAHPYELLQTLNRMMAEKKFKGTCPVCKGWL